MEWLISARKTSKNNEACWLFNQIMRNNIAVITRRQWPFKTGITNWDFAHQFKLGVSESFSGHEKLYRSLSREFAPSHLEIGLV